VWVTVALTPIALLCLRLVDDSAAAVIVQPVVSLIIVVLLVTVAAAVRTNASDSLSRTLAGGGGALLAAALLVLPMTQVIGQRPCPDRMGSDRGLQVSRRLFDAWRRGGLPPTDVWAKDAVADGWRARVRDVALLDYRLEDSGCWERLAPVTTSKTWHEYRVTVRRAEGDSFSKVVIVHTRAARGGWRLAGIEGP
jgi:hypothetical protein